MATTETDAPEIQPAEAPPQALPAGWYANPGGPGQRWWDGSHWGEQYREGPPQGGPRAKGPRVVALIAGLFVAVILGVLVVAVIQEATDDGGGGASSAQEGYKAQNRLDDAMINAFNRTDPTVSVAFSCLAVASNINPYGGPRLAKCVPVAERAATKLRRSRSRLQRVYRTSPSYVRRIYRRAYRGTQEVLLVHTRYVGAMAQWARVHGASSYAGRAEFGVIRNERARVIAADRKHQRLVNQARRSWKRYAKRRWGS